LPGFFFTTKKRLGKGTSMANYTFRICDGPYSGGPDHEFEASDDRAAFVEMIAVFQDLSSDAIRDLNENSSWRIEVRNHAGTLLFTIKISTETFPKAALN
jgi:hypothetical protein